MEYLKRLSIEKRRLLRLIFFALADVFFIFLSVHLAFLVRFEVGIPVQYTLNIWGVILLAWLITLPIFYFFKLYSFTWIYVSTEELIALVKGTALSFLLLTAVFLF